LGPASVHIRRRWSAEHPEKAGQVAGTYGVDAEAIYGYEDFERIKDNGRIDVVYIVLPNSMHAKYTIRALQSGKHVLCEKPMAASLAECEAMIDAARKAERILGVAYRLHYEPMNLG
jgi:predicted dehydrogenase